MLSLRSSAAVCMAAFCVFAAVEACIAAGTTAPPPPIELQLVASGLSNPVYVTHARDDRLFIVEQSGQIRLFQNGGLVPTPFINLAPLLTCCGERGLLGLAFHPQ